MKFYFNFFFLFVFGMVLKIESLLIGGSAYKNVADELARQQVYNVAYMLKLAALVVLVAMIINLFLEWREHKPSKKKLFLLFLFPLFLLICLGVAV